MRWGLRARRAVFEPRPKPRPNRVHFGTFSVPDGALCVQSGTNVWFIEEVVKERAHEEHVAEWLSIPYISRTDKYNNWFWEQELGDVN
jgi:hypothetical protein